MRFGAPIRTGEIMAKRKKQARAQKSKAATARGKARKVAEAVKRTAAKAKPKPAPVKKAARKVKLPVAPAVETVAVEHPAPEFEEVNKVSPGPDEPVE
jgi:hypothetical protein